MTQSDLEGHSERPGDEYSVAYLALLLTRNIRKILLGAVVSSSLVVAVLYFLPRKYTSTVSFTPVSSGGLAAQLSGLASDFGLAIPGQDPSQSPDFYVDLIHTRELLSTLARRKYVIGGTDSLTLAELYELDEGTPEKTLDAVLRKLDEDILTSDANRQTAVVRIRVQTKWPDVSAQIGRMLLAQVNDFTLQTRRTGAQAQVSFIESRVADAKRDLEAAEAALETFLLANREYRSDPRLAFAHDRLEREVTMRQQLFTSLQQGLAQARIEAVRSTPSITVVEPARAPLTADRRHLAIKGVVLFILCFGAFYGVTIISAALSEEPLADADARVELRRAARRLLPLRRWRIHGQKAAFDTGLAFAETPQDERPKSNG